MGALDIAVNTTTNKIYVPNISSGNITVINGATSSITKTITLPSKGYPSKIAVNEATNKIYVIDTLNDDLIIIDGSSDTVLTTLAAGANPRKIAVNKVNNKIYVSDGSIPTISVFDGASNALVESFNVGNSINDFAINTGTNKIYVADSTQAVNVVDGATNTVTATVGVSSPPSALAVNEQTNKLYVLHFNSSDASVIDGASNSVSGSISGLSMPWDIAVNSVTNTVYTISSFGLKVIDGVTNTPVTGVALTDNPYILAVNSSTNKIYTVDLYSNSISVIDGASNLVTSTVLLGTTPTGISVNETTNKIYVTNYSNDTVSIISGLADTISSTIGVGNYPSSVSVNKLTNTAYVANTLSGLLSVVNGDIDSVTGTAQTGTWPGDVAVNEKTNTVYAVNNFYGSASLSVINGVDNSTITSLSLSSPTAVAVNDVTNKVYVTTAANAIKVIDGITNTITTTINLSQNGWDIAVNTVTNKIYVSNIFSGTLTVVDGASNVETATVNVGTEPLGIAVNESSNTIYVSNSGDSTVSIVDGATNTVTATVSVGKVPIAVAVNKASGKVYVANYVSGTVSVIGGTTGPSVPTNLTATATGDGNVMLSWSASSGATSYNLYMASQSGVTKTNYNTLTEGMQHVGVTSPYTHTGLTNGKTYYFAVTAVNSGGESSESTEASAKPVLETTAPVISSVSVTEKGDTATIIWSTDEPSNSKVEYGTSTAYGKEKSDTDNFVSYHSITLTDLEGNKTYNYRVKSTDAWGNSATSPTATFKTTTKLKYTYPKGISLISIPLSLSASAASIFGASFMNIARWSPLENMYYTQKNNPGSSQLNLAAGNGYWIKLSADAHFEAFGTPATSTQNFEVAVSPGWNQIGNPFLEVYKWENVSVKYQGFTKNIKDAVTEKWIGSYAWSYPGQAFGYQLTHYDIEGASRYLVPFYGYWVYSGVQGTLVFHYDKTGTTATAASKAVDAGASGILSVKVKASTEDAADEGGFFGISKGKTRDVVRKPPDALESRFKTYFASGGDETASDFHGNASQKEQVWDFVVECEGTKNVTLSWDIQKFPSGAKLFLQDVTSGETTDMTARSSLTASVSGKKAFKIKYYKPSVLSEGGDSGTLFVSKPFMFPNPDKTGNATFRYVTGPQVVRVSIEVYNVAGKLVDKFDGDLNGETHWLFGDSVASGVYVYRITAYAVDGKESVLGKMVVVK